MSNNGFAESPLKWFSVGVRFYAPAVSEEWVISNITVRAVNADEAIEKGRTIWREARYDSRLNIWRLKDGIVIEPPFLFDAFEYPPERSRALSEKYLKTLPAGNVGGASSGEGGAIIYQLPKRSSPGPEKSG